MTNDSSPTLFPMQDVPWTKHTPRQLLSIFGNPASQEQLAQPQIPKQAQTNHSEYTHKLPRRFPPSVVARAAIVMHLRERQHLKFREISKLLHYEGPGKTRDLYSRACTLRRLFTSELPPDIKAAWRLQLLSAFDLDPTPEQDLPPDP